MEITIINQTNQEHWNRYEPLFQEIAAKTTALLSLPNDYECSIILVDAKAIKTINKDYRHIDKATDVISFAMLDEPALPSEATILGDIFINVEAVVSQALDYGHSEKREIGFLFAHGLLHLLGYDHLNKDDEKVMFDLQDQILETIIPR